MENRFCAIYDRHGVGEKEHFDTKEEAIEFLESGYKNDQCFPHMVIDLLTRQVVWKFDVVKI